MPEPLPKETPLKLKVAEALSKDVGRAMARMGPEDLERLGVAIGDLVEVAGKRQTIRVFGSKPRTAWSFTLAPWKAPSTIKAR